ncbi:hypothetical protein C2E23DRAFT_863028 [Lenzites betulinus]|nr:hypothetical protein C2E23DRAFT_863028 [Lenzites betulinus]
MDDILSDTGADDSDGTTVFVLQPPRVSSSFERDLAPSESGSDTAVDTSSSESSTEEDSEVENSPLNRSPSLQKNKSLLRATTPPRSHAHTDQIQPMADEYYFVNLVTTQFDSHYSNNKEEELFRLEVDTVSINGSLCAGSDVTWVLTSGVYKLPPDSKKTADTITTPVHLRAYDADELGAHSVMVNVGIDLDCPPPVTEANIERLCDGVVKYADLSRVMIKLVKCIKALKESPGEEMLRLLHRAAVGMVE